MRDERRDRTGDLVNANGVNAREFVTVQEGEQDAVEEIGNGETFGKDADAVIESLGIASIVTAIGEEPNFSHVSGELLIKPYFARKHASTLPQIKRNAVGKEDGDDFVGSSTHVVKTDL